MPSVITRWSGRCPQTQKRDDLTRYLRVLAEINHGYWADHPSPIAAVNRAMHRAAGIAPLTGATWREFDIPVEGRIVVSGDIIRGGFGSSAEGVSAIAERLSESGLPVSMTQMPDARCETALERCRLRGIDFIVFDPRRLFPGGDRLSFVFLSETGCPLLEGCLVEVHERGIFAIPPRDDIDGVMCELGAPGLHLRYMHETWLDCLMTWIRWHFIDELSYWRNEEWPDAAFYNDWFSTAAQRQGVSAARDSIFAKLCDEFIVECDTWIDRAERNFEKNEPT